MTDFTKREQALEKMTPQERQKALAKIAAREQKRASEEEKGIFKADWQAIKDREAIKREMETTQKLLRDKRKKYLKTNNIQDCELSPVEYEKLMFLFLEYKYEKFPIQMGAILVESLKYPIEEIRDWAYEYEDGLLESGYVDLGFWISRLSKDYVPNGAWRLFEKHIEKFKKYKVVFAPHLECWKKEELLKKLQQ